MLAVLIMGYNSRLNFPDQIYPLDIGLLYTLLYTMYRHLSSGNFNLFCNFQNNFCLLGKVIVLLHVDTAADCAADWRHETNRVLGFFVLGKRYAHLFSPELVLFFLLPHYSIYRLFVNPILSLFSFFFAGGHFSLAVTFWLAVILAGGQFWLAVICAG